MSVLRSGSATHVGRVRGSNQDLALESPTLYAVADGMGGHVGGEVAARVAIDTLDGEFGRQPSARGLQQAVSAANTEVWRQSQERPDLRGMGTTLTAVALVPGSDGDDVLTLANVGDSRAYIVSGTRINQITADHSLAEEKVRLGELSQAEAAVHPHRHILTRALGVAPIVDIDLWELHLMSGDRIILCSDGLSNEVSDQQIAQISSEHVDPEGLAHALVAAANQHGGNDNITVVVVDVMIGSEDDQRSARAITVAGIPPGTSVARDPLAEMNGSEPPGIVPPLDDPARTGPTGAPLARGDGETGVVQLAAVRAAAARPPDDGAPADVVADELTADDIPEPDEADEAAPDGVTAETAGGGAAGAGAGSAATGDARDSADPGPQAEADGDATELRDPGTGVEATQTVRRPIVIAGPAPEPKKHRFSARSRRLTLRVVLFFLILGAIVAAGYSFVHWYAYDTYYVTLKGDEVVIYQGHPGGILGYQPRLVSRTGTTTVEVPPTQIPKLKGKVVEPSLHSAKQYVNNLRQEEIAQLQIENNQTPGATTTVPPTSTTTAPATPGVTAAPGSAPTVPGTTATTTQPTVLP